jgi:arylsulfatase A-like enzyme
VLVFLFSIPAAEADTPNILWLTAEDMSPTLGSWGDRYADTPNLDSFAKESVSYTRAFATAPVCSPARSCLITGVYATSLGTQNLRSEFRIPREMTGFPSYIRKLEYHTSNNTKTDYNTANAQAIIKASWSESNDRAHWRTRKPGQPFFSIFNDMTTHQSRTMVWTFEHFRKEVQTQLSPDDVHRAERAPIPPYYPDTPVIRETVARFYDCVSVMDQNIGKRLKELEEDGLAEETIVFFYSDHGSGMPRHKRLLLDSGMHVPLMIRFPKKYQHLAPAQPGDKIDRLVSFVDFAPTVLSLLDITPPDYMQGTAFLGPSAGHPREYVFGARDRVDEAFDMARSVRDKRYLYIRNYKPHVSYNQPSAYSDLGEIRDEITALARGGKLKPAQLHYAGPRRPVEELYDTEADPQNLRNLAGSKQYRDILERLRTAQADWCSDTIDLGYLPEIDAGRISQGSTPFETARKPDTYPLEKIRDMADMVGVAGATDIQIQRLRDSDSAVRYWAAVGLHASGEGSDALNRALDDPSPPVRIEAAGALLQRGENPDALAVLVHDLQANDQNVVLLAARALQLLGETSRPAVPQIRAAQEKAANNSTTINLFINFATTMHLVELGEIKEASVFSSFR